MKPDKILIFGDFRIHDTDGDDRFDPQVDQALDAQSQPLSQSQFKNKSAEVLKNLGHTDWKGISLRRTSRYFMLWQRAEQLASQGYWQSAEILFDNLEARSQEISLTFQKTRANGSVKASIEKSIETTFQGAEKMAQQGQPIDAIDIEFNLIESDIEDYGQRFQPNLTFDQNRADRILKGAFANNIPRMLQEAKLQADLGSLSDVENILHQLEILVFKGNQRFPKLQLQFPVQQEIQILERAYRQSLPNLWRRAEGMARMGKPNEVKEILRNLQKNVREGNRKFKLGLSYDLTQAETISELAYLQAVKAAYQDAMTQARAANLSGLRRSLKETVRAIDTYNFRFGNQSPYLPLKFDRKVAQSLFTCARKKTSCIP